MFAVSILVAVQVVLPLVVAEKVTQNEALYRDIDVSYTSEYRLAPGRDGGEVRTLDGRLAGRTTLAKDTTTRVVLQKDMYRVGVTTTTNDGKETTTRSFAHAYDGKTNRIRERNVTETFDGSRPLPQEAFFPHLWATAPLWDAFSLSVPIAGGKRWEDVRDRGSKGQTLTSRVLDLSATFAGERCVVVRCEFRRLPRAVVSTSWDYWLAVNKNYLPIQTVSYVHYYSAVLPIQTVECGDVQELRRGVWLPHRVTTTVFDEIELRDAKRSVVSNVTKTSVTAVKLGPNFDPSFFRVVQPEK